MTRLALMWLSGVVLTAAGALLATAAPAPVAGADEPAAAAAPAQQPPESGKKPEDPPKAEEKPADPPAEPAEPADPPSTADEIMDLMRRQKPSNEPIMPKSMDSKAEGGGGFLMPEGSRISRKSGRIVKDGSWWIFVPESDMPDRPEPRMKLLPCLHLEQMVRETEHAAAEVVYVVSGEVTVFQEENYLLVRVATRRASLGNLRP
jgi:hypothetical protein